MASTTKKATASEVSLEIRRTFPASRERVFRAWTRPEELNQWSAPGPATPTTEVDLRVGGRYRIVMRGPDGTTHIVGGVYRVVEPPSRLVYTWKWEGNPEAVESLVTVEFQERRKSTDVVLRHEGLRDPADRDRHQEGWTGCLDKLSALMQQ
jgi:uncharacterized protein YndB with AHSA1/START domain